MKISATIDLASIGATLHREAIVEQQDGSKTCDASAEALVRGLFSERHVFGITRLGSVTRLDTGGVQVAQVVRPLSMSEVVSQGKGRTCWQAAASAFVECLETWAAERVGSWKTVRARASDLGREVCELYAGFQARGVDAGWTELPLEWVNGYDLLTERILPVPTALVDTRYILPSPHIVRFPRTTTGLAGGATLLSALVHAVLEILERSGVAESERSFRRRREHPVNPASRAGPTAGELLQDLIAAQLTAQVWAISSDHGLPLYRVHVSEQSGHRRMTLLPGLGFGCDFTHDGALARALMEAAQARMTAISGVREDITREQYLEGLYGEYASREMRTERRDGKPTWAPNHCEDYPAALERLKLLREALIRAGARAAVVIPLLSLEHPRLEVVRVVAPPLRHMS